MVTKDSILAYLRENKKALEANYKVVTIGLCGSYARGDQRPESDIDLVVEMSEPDFFLRMALAEYLSTAFGKEVQLLTKIGMKTILWRSIAEDICYV